MPRKKRQFTPDDKLKILEEARQPNTTVAEVLRRHQVDPTTFYRWEQQAKEAVRAALARDRRRTESLDKDHEIERLKAELAKKSRIIAEVIEENLELKTKKTLNLGARTRYTAEEKAAVLWVVDQALARTGWAVRRPVRSRYAILVS
jgi:transposase